MPVVTGEPPTEKLATVLAALGVVHRSVAIFEYEAVQLLRAHGASWEQIGDQLEISGQAAARRFSRPRGRRL